MERVTVRMARSDRHTPWGFGVTEDQDRNVVIVNVVGGSLADRAGLRNGDVIDKLEDLGDLDINAVDRLLVTAHEKIELLVHRNPSGPTRIWHPEVTENVGGGDERPYRVNLQHSSDSRPPQGFNNSALPFETDPRVKHLQYNSPLGLYSEKSAAEQYNQQTSGFVDHPGVKTSGGRDEPAYLRSETLRLLKEEENRGGPTTLSNHPNPNGLPVCFICGRPILGVMARAAGRDLHGDCLSCATCGNSLRNVGHHFIDDKFYCDIHGSQKKTGGRPSMDPNLFVKSPPTAAHPTRPVESPKAAYQPSVMATRPLSVSPTLGAGGGTTVTTHYHTPKTQGILSPSQRGVPTAQFGADLSRTVNYGGGAGAGARLSPSSQHSTGSGRQNNYDARQIDVQVAPPPPPSNPPPSANHSNESRVPSSVRDAVSPRRRGKIPRQWPPPATPVQNRYWQIDPAGQMKKERPRTPETLKEMIKNCEKDVEPRQPKQNARSRRRSQISKEQVQQAFREHQARSEAQKSSQEGGTQEKAQKSSSEPQEQVQQSYKMPPAQEQIFNKPQAQEQVQGSFRVPQAQNQAQQSFRQAQAQERVQESYKAPQVQVQEENFRAPEQSFRVPQAQQQVFQKPQAHEQVQKSNQLPQAQERVQETFQAPQTKDKVQQPYRAPQNAVFRKPQAHELLQQSYIVPQGQGQVQQTYRVPQPQQQVQKSFQVPRTQEKAQETYRAPPAQDPTVSEAAVAESVTLDVSITSHKPPEIRDGKIHWTVIHSPKTSPVGPAPPRITTSKPEPEIRRPIPVLPNNSERSKNSYSERELTRPLPVPAAPVVNVSAPEPSIASQKSPIEISRTSIPKPFTSSQAPKKAVSSVNFSEVERPSELKESSVSLKPSAVETADSSTSPIPVVRLQRRRESKEEPLPPTPMVQNSKEQPKLTASPVPFPSVLRHQQKLEEQKLKPASPIPLIQVEKNSSAEEDTTESVIPREPVYLKKPPPKVLKKVDFSRATVIPDTNRWADNADIVDESDILTEASRDEDSISLPNFDYKTTEFLRTSAVYDGDESEMIDNKSDVASTLDMDEEQEQDQEPEPEQRHQKGTSSSSQVAPDAEKQWRQRAMELLEDDAQTERDLMIVAALNERLQGLREMEDEDRLRAIECIARHQNDLEQTQTQLSSLLESAIVYLQNLGVTGSGKEENEHENENENEEEDEVTERPPTPPQRMYFSTDVKTESLLDVLDEWQSITFNNNNLHDHQRQPEGSSVTIRSGSDIVGRPQWQRDERDDVVERSKTFLAERLARQMNLGDENATTNERRGGTYTKTVTEQTTEQRRPYTGPGSGQEFRGTGSLTTTTQHQGGRIPFCEACKQQIRGAFVLATGLAWCPEHFVCANRACGRRLLECGFVEERGEKFCESCFERDIAPRCAKCIKAIVSDCLNALQKKWHPTCFTCAHCQKPFGNSAFYLEQGLPYCERDWNALFTTKCVSCTYPIEAGDRWVEALNNAFHSNCFTCTSCHHNLEGESFFAKNGLPFCKLHA